MLGKMAPSSSALFVAGGSFCITRHRSPPDAAKKAADRISHERRLAGGAADRRRLSVRALSGPGRVLRLTAGNNMAKPIAFDGGYTGASLSEKTSPREARFNQALRRKP